MKNITVLFLLIPSLTFADESPFTKFSTENNFTQSSKIEWEQVDDIQKACNEQRINSGEKVYTYKVDACSAWSVNIFQQHVCHIITEKNVSMWTIGHEIRHCFQGNFH